jgi:hypothetical protein
MPPDYLNPKQPIGIEPAADRNIERITTCCLDASPKMSFFMGKGRLGGAWWMIWIMIASIVPAILIPPFLKNTVEVYQASLSFASITVIGFSLSLLWPILVWKKNYPIRFNRKTRKVYCHWYGKTYIEDWDTIRAYLKIQTDFNAQGAPSQVPQIHIEFHKDNGSVFTNPLLGLTSVSKGLAIDQEAMAAWEYIRRYMEEGPDGLALPELGIERALAFDELLTQSTPFPIIRSENKLMWPLHIGLFFPTRFVWFLITYPTEVLYYWLDKHVDMNPFPPEMDEPCRCEDEVVIWHPKMRLEQRRNSPAKQPKQKVPIIR